MFLLYLGLETFRSEPAERAADATDRGGLLGEYSSTFLLTLTNPMTILAFVGVFAGLGVGVGTEYRTAVVLVTGVFTGSTLWWLLLSSGVSLLRTRFTPAWMRRVSRLAGLVIVGFGLRAIWSGVH